MDEKIVEKIVDKVIEDLSCKKCLKHEWEQFNDDMKIEIKESLKNIILESISTK